MKRLVLLAVIAISLAGCFEDAVDERLELRFRSNGSLRIDLTVELDWPFVSTQGPRARRLAETEGMLLGGWSSWSGRFAALGAQDESLSWRREDGHLTRYRHWAVTDPEAVVDLFSDSFVQAFYQAGDGWAELGLYPSAGTRARREQLDIVDEALAAWIPSLVAYQLAVADLWDHLDREPYRAQTVFSALFGEGEVEDMARAKLSEAEAELVGELADRMGDTLEIHTEEVDGWSFEELSRLAYDPFPARVTIVVPGAIEASEGLVDLGDGRFMVPRFSFESAFARLEDRWLTPDLLLTYLRHERSATDEPFDVEGLARRPRWATPSLPDTAELTDALVEQLQPEAAYRVVWGTPASDAD